MPDSQLPSKALTLFNATKMFPWSSIEYKFLSQTLWIYTVLFLLKATQSSASVVHRADSKRLKTCDDIHKVNLSQMH